jgi:hypothetical protein
MWHTFISEKLLPNFCNVPARKAQVAHIPVTDYVLGLFPIQWETY